jgi:hypothetical protein
MSAIARTALHAGPDAGLILLATGEDNQHGETSGR